MNLKDAKQRLLRRARRSGVTVPQETAEALTAYLQLLYRWDAHINLTSITDPDEAVDRLLLEPLIAARYLPAGSLSLMDVGSGGGSPAIPLKLVASRLRLVLVEAKTRKCAFLREVVRQLELPDVRIETARVEELLPRPELHEAMDVVTLRAVRVESRLLLRLQAFLVPGGQFLLFRGPSGPEVPAQLTPPLEWVATHPLVESLRSRLLVIRKVRVGGRQ